MYRKKRNRDFDFSVSSDEPHNDISGRALEFHYAIGLFLKTKDGFRYTGKNGTQFQFLRKQSWRTRRKRMKLGICEWGLVNYCNEEDIQVSSGIWDSVHFNTQEKAELSSGFL